MPTNNRVTLLAQRATLSEVLRRLGATPETTATVAEPVVRVWRAHEDSVLFREGEPAQALHIVRSGGFKCLRTLEDGYEQVVSFVQPGGLLGIEALADSVHLASAIALEDSTVFALPARELAALQGSCPQLEHALWRALSMRLAHAAETSEMMAAVSSEARLARFLLWMSRRMAEANQSPRRLRLPMARRDIASLLGVAHETVSRAFTALASSGCIRVHDREVEVLEVLQLRQRARCTRGLPAEGAITRSALLAQPQPQPLPRTPLRERPSWWGALEPVGEAA